MHKVLKVGNIELDQVSAIRLSVMMLTAAATKQIMRCELPLTRKIKLEYELRESVTYTPSEASTVCVTVAPEYDQVTFAYGPDIKFVEIVKFSSVVDSLNRMVGTNYQLIPSEQDESKH